MGAAEVVLYVEHMIFQLHDVTESGNHNRFSNILYDIPFIIRGSQDAELWLCGTWFRMSYTTGFDTTD